MKAIGYLRVSTSEQSDSGLGVAAQRATITAEADRRGWDVVWIIDEGYSGKNLSRPGMTEALRLLAAGEADALVTSKLDRLSRSVVDFANTLALAKKQGWSIVLLDLAVDTSTPNGKLVAGLMAQIAEWERDIIAQRTREALAAAKARGTRLGRPRAINVGLLLRIVGLRDQGLSLRQIAAVLNDEGVPTVRGGRCWHPATIRGLLTSHLLDQPEAETDLSTTNKKGRAA